MKKLLHLFPLVMAFVMMAFCPTNLWAQDCNGNHTFDNYHDPDHTVCTVCGHSFIYYTTATSIGGDDGQIEGENEEKLRDREDFTQTEEDEVKYYYSEYYICNEDNTTKDDEKRMYVTELDYTLDVLPKNAFRRSNVVKVILPNSIKEIEGGAFIDCNFLEEITFGNSLEKIEKRNPGDYDDGYCKDKGTGEIDPFYNSNDHGHTKNFRSVPSFPMTYYNLSFELTDQSYITEENGNQAESTVRYASYKRKMPNKWGTIMLPLKIYEDSEDYDLYDYKGYDSEKNELTLERLSSYDYDKGKCVLIRMSENTKNATDGMYDLVIKRSIDQPDESGQILSVEINDNNSFNGLKLTGTYILKELESGYIIANNAFWNVESLEDNVYCQAFRGYLEISSSNNAPSRLSIGFENVDNTTPIEILEAITEGKAEYFDMNGLRIDDLKQGLNIVKRGNKTYKVIIK